MVVLSVYESIGIIWMLTEGGICVRVLAWEEVRVRMVIVKGWVGLRVLWDWRAARMAVPTLPVAPRSMMFLTGGLMVSLWVDSITVVNSAQMLACRIKEKLCLGLVLCLWFCSYCRDMLEGRERYRYITYLTMLMSHRLQNTCP